MASCVAAPSPNRGPRSRSVRSHRRLLPGRHPSRPPLLRPPFPQSATQADARSSDPRSSDASDAHAYADAYAEEEQLCPARELLGAIEHCGTSSARGAFCTNSRPFCGAPSRRKQSLRQRSSFTCRPAQRKIFFSWWSGGPFQADGGGEERAGRGCKWPGRTYLQCLGPLHWSLG